MKFFLAIVMLSSFAVHGADISLFTTVESNYVVLSGVKARETPVAKTNWTVSFENGWLGEVFTAVDAHGFVEADYVVGKKLGDFTLKAGWFDVGQVGRNDGDVFRIEVDYRKSGGFATMAYLVVDKNPASSGAIGEIGMEKNYSFLSLKGRVGYDYTFELRRPFVRLDVGTSWPLGKNTLLLGPGVKVFKNRDNSAVTWIILGLTTTF